MLNSCQSEVDLKNNLIIVYSGEIGGTDYCRSTMAGTDPQFGGLGVAG
jgi:hypothetical protein